MSDCSTHAFRILPRGHYLNGYKDGVNDSICSWEPAYNDLKQRYQQLEQVAKELWTIVMVCAVNNEPPSMEAFGAYIPRLEALGVSLDD